MFDRAKLESVKQAAEREDWTAAADVCAELSLASRGTRDEFYAQELELAVSHHDAELLGIIRDYLTDSD